jgi:hypothetical protein
MTRQAINIDAFDINEVDDVVFDFSDKLLPGETIQSAQVLLRWLDGADDASAQAMATGSCQIGIVSGDTFTPDPAGQQVVQRITANDVEANYSLKCIANISDGRELVAPGYMPVRDF